jgi:glycosyltransferase involved in cell wall biosynthesis
MRTIALMADTPAHIAYLFSRFPVVSQTFCDSEMLGLEALGDTITVGSINPPTTSLRHQRLKNLKANACYPPPARVLKALQKQAETDGTWRPLGDMVERHLREYGESFKPEIRARNALYFTRLFKTLSVEHVHVHFANRATHTAMFMKELGMPFSFTAHAQDFMIDLGSDRLLAEMCDAAEFVIAVSDYSSNLLRERCPRSIDKIHRVYNGIRPEDFPSSNPGGRGDGVFRIVSVGRLIEFKGFQHLIAACGQLAREEINFECTIIGDGPWLEKLQALAETHNVSDRVRFAGVQPQEQVKAELVRSDCFCLPSILDSKGASDILPTVIMEAMACRLPVVSTEFVGIPEMVVPGHTGILVEPGDEADLADALKVLARDESISRAFGENGYARAAEIFSLSTTTPQLREHFTKSLARHSGEKPPTQPANTVYLVDAFPFTPDLQQDEEFQLALDWPGLAVLIADITKPSAIEKSPAASAAEFFPDGIVLEAEWRNAPDTVEQLENLRTDLGTAVSGEQFFREARRALWLATMMKKRAIRHIHASRSTSLLCAWIVKKLANTKLTVAIEDDPTTSPSLIAKLCKDADLVSVSDADLAREITGAKDTLSLKILPDHRRIGIGKLSIKVRRTEGEGTTKRRRERARAWLDQLVKFAH